MNKHKNLRRHSLIVLLWLAAVVGPPPAAAQISKADSAAVLLSAARQIGWQGDAELARELMRHVVREFPDTPAARDALSLLSTDRARDQATSGRAGLIVSNTLFGAWLGVAVPAALGAETPSPYGAGLLLGAPTGFVAARLFSDQNPMSSGQAIATTFGSWWGTWQGVGWRDLLDIGTRKETYCYGEFGEQCGTYEVDSHRAPFAAAVIGGLTGLVAGGAIAQVFEPTAGTSTTVQLGSLWGSWFGFSSATLMDQTGEDARLAWSLIGGNVGLLASVLATQHVEMSSGRAWLVSAAGVAGGVAGLGIDLIAETNDAQSAIVAPMLLSLGGLAIGVALTRDFDEDARVFDRPAAALIEFSGKSVAFGPVIPTPTLLPAPGQTGPDFRLGVRIPVLAASF